MTRAEHIAWCKQRAIDEMNFYKMGSKGIVSMMSDLRKHPETNSETLISLCAMILLTKPNITMQQAKEFIQGFN